MVSIDYVVYLIRLCIQGSTTADDYIQFDQHKIRKEALPWGKGQCEPKQDKMPSEEDGTQCGATKVKT